MWCGYPMTSSCLPRTGKGIQKYEIKGKFHCLASGVLLVICRRWMLVELMRVLAIHNKVFPFSEDRSAPTINIQGNVLSVPKSSACCASCPCSNIHSAGNCLHNMIDFIVNPGFVSIWYPELKGKD